MSGRNLLFLEHRLLFSVARSIESGCRGLLLFIADRVMAMARPNTGEWRGGGFLPGSSS